jgi:hypothetical protein
MKIVLGVGALSALLAAAGMIDQAIVDTCLKVHTTRP